MTKHISLIIDQEYESGLSLRKSGSAYLTPLESTDGLNYDANTGKLYFEGVPVSEAKLEEISRGKVVEIGEFDLPLLKLFYSIILADIKNTINQNQYAINESFTIYLPDLAELMGKGRNLSDNDIIMLRIRQEHSKPSTGLFAIQNIQNESDPLYRFWFHWVMMTPRTQYVFPLPTCFA